MPFLRSVHDFLHELVRVHHVAILAYTICCPLGEDGGRALDDVVAGAERVRVVEIGVLREAIKVIVRYVVMQVDIGEVGLDLLV